MGKSQGAALGAHRSRSIKMGSPTDWHLGVQRNSHALRTLQLWPGGLAAGWTSQASALRSQTSEALAQRLSCRDVPPNKPRPCDGPCDGCQSLG